MVLTAPPQMDVTVVDAPEGLTTDIYTEIKRRLVMRGIPPHQIAFIHDAKTAAARQRMFDAVNSGEIRVLLGSTEKMGTGMNAQERLVALHQITPPWKPADITQQVGRVLRQGNRYPQVFQFVYVTENSFDGYMWQSLETKLRFIEQVDADYSIREVDDISDTVLSFSELKALASGNPKIMRKVTLEAEMMRLSALRSAWKSGRMQAEYQRRHLERFRDLVQKEIVSVEAAIRARDSHDGEDFSIRLKQTPFGEILDTITDRKAAGARLISLIHAAGTTLRGSQTVVIGEYRGVEIGVHLHHHVPAGKKNPVAFPQPHLEVGSQMVFGGNTPAGILRSLEHRLKNLAPHLDELRAKLDRTIKNLAALDEELAQTWEHEERYRALNEELAGLIAELKVDSVEAAEEAESATADLKEVLTVDATSEAVAKAQADLAEALRIIREMHTNLDVLDRFDVSADTENVPVPEPASLPEVAVLEAAIEQRQEELLQVGLGLADKAALPTGEVVQLDMFGGFSKPKPRRRKRRKKLTHAQQIALFG